MAAPKNQLVYAAGKGYAADVAGLLKSLNVNSTDDLQNTALHVASGAGHKDVVELLLKQKGVQVNAQNNVGDTPLHKAAFRNHADIVKLLLAAGAKEVKNKRDKTPLDVASNKEVEALLLKDADGAGGDSDSD